MYLQPIHKWLFPGSGHQPWQRAKALLIAMLVVAPTFFQAALSAQETHILPLQFGAPIVGRPFSGTRTLDYEPAANSPDPIAFHAEQVCFRDSEGRTRSETTYPGKLKTIDIIDPVAHLHYYWTVGDSVAIRGQVKEVSPLSKATEKLSAGAPVVEGLPTRHSHSATGKDKVEKSVDSWYSPDLSLAIVTIIDEPGKGKTTYRFTHVSRDEPDAGLFRVPKELAVEDSDSAPPPAIATNQEAASSGKSARGKPSFPHPIEDDNYLEALARFHAAVPRWLPSSSYHRHTDVRMIDIYGNESRATVDHWQKGQFSRDEELASGWHSTTVWGATQHWSTHEGISPLRLFSLSDLTPRPGPAERRIRIYAQGYVAMKRGNGDGPARSCSQEYAGAELCFDTATGFPASASVDDERVVYEQWAQYEGAAYPGRVALYRGHRLQMEATTTVTALDGSSRTDSNLTDSSRAASNSDLFQPLPGVTPSPNRDGASRGDKYTILKGSRMDTSSSGEALVKVSVGESGRVLHAELLDADDKSLGKAAIAAAKELVYMPLEVNSRSVPFETTFWTSHWSIADPLNFPATSRQSQGTD